MAVFDLLRALVGGIAILAAGSVILFPPVLLAVVVGWITSIVVALRSWLRTRQHPSARSRLVRIAQIFAVVNFALIGLGAVCGVYVASSGSSVKSILLADLVLVAAFGTFVVGMVHVWNAGRESSYDSRLRWLIPWACASLPLTLVVWIGALLLVLGHTAGAID